MLINMWPNIFPERLRQPQQPHHKIRSSSRRKAAEHRPSGARNGSVTLIEPAQQELTEAYHRFDDPEHRFRGLFAQRIEPFACWRPQPIGHGLGRRWVARRRRRRRGKPLAQGLMVWLTAGRNQRRDVRGRAERHIGLAEIAIVGQQCLGPAEVFRQDIDLLKHRRDLLLVVGRLNHFPGDHQKALRRHHHRLRVVALIKPAARPTGMMRESSSVNRSGLCP